ncbi:MAG: SusD/RagB family nutrient-binding outer membrane lipoprotein, partial [Alistipes sp.]
MLNKQKKMKTILIKTAVVAVVGLIIAGCSKFDDINTNPDKPSSAKAGWFVTNMLTTITQSTAMRTTGFKQPYNLSKYVLWTELQASLQYNNLDRISFTNKFMPLKNIAPMVAAAPDAEQKSAYTALGHFLRAWQFFQTSIRVGDIPYSEAILGDAGITKPKYDTQKEVFKGIIAELDEADKLFAKGKTFEGDFIFAGNVDKWRRLSNSFQLYVLINLYKKSSDPDLNVINKFKEVAQRPLMRDFNDNFAMTFNGSKGYCYPWSNTAADLNEFTQYTMLSTYYIDLLKQGSDRRLFYVAEPSARLVKAGKEASSFEAYEGVEPSAEYTSTITAKQNGAYSDLNLRYVENGKAEPVGLL